MSMIFVAKTFSVLLSKDMKTCKKKVLPVGDHPPVLCVEFRDIKPKEKMQDYEKDILEPCAISLAAEIENFIDVEYVFARLNFGRTDSARADYMGTSVLAYFNVFQDGRQSITVAVGLKEKL